MRIAVLLFFTVLAVSCTKSPVPFGNDGAGEDLNIFYTDTFSIDLATVQQDSFSTAGSGRFIVGDASDASFGVFSSKAYLEINPPSANELNGCTCVFDSIVFKGKLSGGFRGDTTKPFTLNISRLTQLMDDNNDFKGYNTVNLTYANPPLGSKTMMMRPLRNDTFTVRLNDMLGRDLFAKLKNNSDTITNQETFIDYFRGLVLTGGAPGGSALYYLGANDTGNAVIRLHYTIKGITPKSAYVDFVLGKTTHQFNAFTYDRSGTALRVFTPKKPETIASYYTGNKVFVHPNGGLTARITFPTLLSLKELHPYVKVLRAELEIDPAAETPGTQLGYPIPPQISLHLTDDNNQAGSAVDDGAQSPSVQYGNLYIDYLYGKDTRYTYDLTSFVRNFLATDRFHSPSLLLSAVDSASDHRLVINDRKFDRTVKLKLYVLGL